MTRKYQLTINNTIVDVAVDGPHNGVLTITIGEASFPVQVVDGNIKSGKYKITVGDTQHTLQLSPNPNVSDFTLIIDRTRYTTYLKPLIGTTTRSYQSTVITPSPSTFAPASQAPSTTIQEPTEPGTVTAPLPGRVLEVRVKEGTTVKTGDVLLVLEAMKMANEIRAPQDGKVSTIHVEAGTAVEKGQPMITIQ